MSVINNLVTGGAGFIGSNLIAYLLKNKENVICVDNFSYGDMRNLSKFKNNSNLKIINQDVINSFEIENINKVWHLASIASPLKYEHDPIKTAKVNFLGTLNMLELARKNEARFLFASTSEIYGNNINDIIREDSLGELKTESYRSCYFESKRLSETMCFDYLRKFNLETKVARIFNSYGPNMSLTDGRVIGNFIRQTLNSKSLTIYGNGDQTRSFCFISDLIFGLVSLMNSTYKGPINFGNPEEISIIHLAKKILKKTNNKCDLIYKKKIIDEPPRRKPCIDLAKKLLNWQPLINLDDGLDMTIEFYKKNF